MYAASNGAMIWRVSLARIGQVVATHLGRDTFFKARGSFSPFLFSPRSFG